MFNRNIKLIFMICIVKVLRTLPEHGC